ncbi:hypothetical protein FB451DRAFT_1188319 [Mycena latifolia]|nr:hypothetical protein FB451DRAFT_1188319 [Mycena latifolia]
MASAQVRSILQHSESCGSWQVTRPMLRADPPGKILARLEDPPPRTSLNVLATLHRLAHSSGAICLDGLLATHWDPFASEVLRSPSTFASMTAQLCRSLDAYKADATPTTPTQASLDCVSSCTQIFIFVCSINLRKTLDACLPAFDQLHVAARKIVTVSTMFRPQRAGEIKSLKAVPAFKALAQPGATVVDLNNPGDHCCGVIRFADRLCAPEAWNTPWIPHKSICTPIHILSVVLALQRQRGFRRTSEKQAYNPSLSTCFEDSLRLESRSCLSTLIIGSLFVAPGDPKSPGEA